MSREIKFKAKRKDGKGWVYGLPFYSYGTGIWKMTHSNGWTPSYGNPDEGEGTEYTDIDYNTLSQSTGLKDKNGVDIYEGDYITCIWSTPDGDNYHKGFVKYDSLNTKFYSHSLKQEISRSLSGINKNIEVTGNIHDKN